MSKVAFITAILGNYETSCKKPVEQTIDCDFICFTDNKNIVTNGWEIDLNPYYETHKSPLDTGYYLNSIKKPGAYLSLWNNEHTFNLAKYYKTQWHLIPRLKDYETIIWCDGTIEILASNAAEYLSQICSKYEIACWHHEMRGGLLFHEAYASEHPKYYARKYLDQLQPYQNIIGQYLEYVREGYDETFFKEKFDRVEGRGRGDHFGVWATGCVSFSNTSERVKTFLDLWYSDILKYSTQDQVSFPKIAQTTGLVPYTFPDTVFTGLEAHTVNKLFKVHSHGA
jgi:hypothetical protein